MAILPTPKADEMYLLVFNPSCPSTQVKLPDERFNEVVFIMINILNFIVLTILFLIFNLV